MWIVSNGSKKKRPAAAKPEPKKEVVETLPEEIVEEKPQVEIKPAYKVVTTKNPYVSEDKDLLKGFEVPEEEIKIEEETKEDE